MLATERSLVEVVKQQVKTADYRSRIKAESESGSDDPHIEINGVRVKIIPTPLEIRLSNGLWLNQASNAGLQVEPVAETDPKVPPEYETFHLGIGAGIRARQLRIAEGRSRYPSFANELCVTALAVSLLVGLPNGRVVVGWAQGLLDPSAKVAQAASSTPAPFTSWPPSYKNGPSVFGATNNP